MLSHCEPDKPGLVHAQEESLKPEAKPTHNAKVEPNINRAWVSVLAVIYM